METMEPRKFACYCLPGAFNFSVKAKTISTLRERIHGKITARGQNVLLGDLVLYKTEIPLVHGVTRARTYIAEHQENALDTKMEIANVFDDTYNPSRLDIIVTVAGDAEEHRRLLDENMKMTRSSSWWERAWKAGYEGDAHINLLKHIKGSIGLGAYENSGAIIQSSGYGKSRTVDEMAKLVPTIPTNLRAAEDSHDGAYPPPDTPLVTLFRYISDSSMAVDLFHLFFATLFGHVAEKIETLDTRSGQSNLAVLLRDDLERDGSRSRLYEAVSRDFHAHLVNITQPCDFKQQAVEALCGLMKKLSSDDQVSLILYIDEAEMLPNLVGATGSLYDAIIKAIAEYHDHKFFVLFLSTSSQLRRLAPPVELPTSARKSRAKLVAPFTEMPFDCHPMLLKGIKPGLKLKDIQQFEFITYFGRPLWWTCFAEDKTQEDETRTLAALKITRLSKGDSLNDLKTPAKVAILAMLLNLQYHASKAETRLLCDMMVAGHMQTAISVSDDRRVMYATFPPETLLAEASLDVVDTIEAAGGGGEDTLATFFADLDQGSKEAIDQGQRGENVAKMILLRAYMGAIKEESGTKPFRQESGIKSFHPWRNGCSLIAFLRHLTANEFYEVVMESRPDNLSREVVVESPDSATNEVTIELRPSLEKAFEKAWVRFTHFARATDDSAMTTSAAWPAFVRGMAMIGWPNQHSVDLHIPVLMDKDKPISESNMSGILIQIKLRKRHSPRPNIAINAEELKYFPPKSPPRPFISLAMEMGKPDQEKPHPPHVVDFLDGKNLRAPLQEGHKSQPTGEKGKQSQQTKKHHPFPSTPRVISSTPPTVMRHPKATHPRYSLFFYGRSHKIYRCVPNNSATVRLYDELLSVGNSSNVLETHPKGRSKDFLYRSKSFWGAGQACYNWVKEPFLNFPIPGQDADESEGVSTGVVDDNHMEVDQVKGEDVVMKDV